MAKMTEAKSETKRKLLTKGNIPVIVVFLVLLVSATAVVLYNRSTIPDLNAGIERVNADYLNVWNGANHVLWRSGVTNAASDSVERIYFWVNVSQFPSMSFVDFRYYNGTHSEWYNATQPILQDSWNYDQWWTDGTWFIPDEFNVTDPGNTRGYQIPRQNGGTLVTFRLTVAVWNGSGLEYTNYNGTYSVFYSQYEVTLEQDVHLTTGFYCALFLLLLAVMVPEVKSISSEVGAGPPEKDKAALTSGLERVSEFSPSEDFLMARSNHLDSLQGSLRTGAGILLTLATGSYVLGSKDTPFFSFLSFGFLLLAIFAFLGIVLSFSSPTIEQEGYEMDKSLLPTGQTLDLYKKQLTDVIKKKAKAVARIEFVVGTGLMYLGTFLLMGLLASFFPAVGHLVDRLGSMVWVYATFGMTFLDSLLASTLVFGPRVMGIVD